MGPGELIRPSYQDQFISFTKEESLAHRLKQAQ